MKADRLKYKEITYIILEVYNELGDEFLKSTHKNTLYYNNKEKDQRSSVVE